MYDIQKALRAKSLSHAQTLLAQYPGAVLTAGGTDVMIRLKHGGLPGATLISLLDVAQLRGVKLAENGDVVIGAGTCFAALEQDPVLLRRAPMVSYACSQVGSPQIRAVATIGGNLCNGAVSADSVPSLLALDAVLELTGPNGPESAPLLGFHTGPGKTRLEPDRILTAIRLPAASLAGHGGCYIKFGQRNALEIATLGCAARVQLDDAKQIVTAVALAYGVAAPTPVRCRRLEAMLVGRVPDAAFFETLRAHVLAELNPRDSWRASKQLRVQLIKELGCRAVRQAIVQAGGTAI